MTKAERLARVVGLSVTVFPLTPASVQGRQVHSIPPDTVTTAFVTDSVPGFGSVGGVAVDNLGFTYVADFQNSLWRFSPRGELSRFASGFYGASGVAVGPRGEVYQASFYGGTVSRVSRTGEVEVWVDQGLAGPVGIAVNPDGELFVCNCRDGSIARVGTDRTVTRFAKSDLLACPNGITFDDQGDLYVVSFNNTLVVRITPEGTVTRFTDIPGAGGNGHISFAKGGFYVTKFRGNRVFRVGRDASVRVVAGTGVAGEADGPAGDATFTRPNGIAVDPTGKFLWVNDLIEGTGAGVGPSVTSLRRVRLVSLSDVLALLPANATAEDVRTAHDRYRSERPDEDTTLDAISLAFQWMSSGRVAAGLALHEANAAAYPDDANVQYNLGEAYRYTGQADQAEAQYRRALELNPDHPLAQARLELLESGS